jgi:hypothetical protein
MQIVYMDHLQFPPNEYVIDYSLPRMCHVKSKDFEFVVATDIDKKKLFNSTIFARRPVSLNSCYQLLVICASFLYVYMFNNYFSFGF